MKRRIQTCVTILGFVVHLPDETRSAFHIKKYYITKCKFWFKWLKVARTCQSEAVSKARLSPIRPVFLLVGHIFCTHLSPLAKHTTVSTRADSLLAWLEHNFTFLLKCRLVPQGRSPSPVSAVWNSWTHTHTFSHATSGLQDITGQVIHYFRSPDAGGFCFFSSF